MFYLHLLADVSRWLAAQNLDGSGLTDASTAAFIQDRRARGRARFRSVQGLAPLMSFLRDAGAAPLPEAAEAPGDEAGILEAEFAGHLTADRGLRPPTVTHYASSARRFLRSLPAGGDGGILAGLTADAIWSFVIAESSRRGARSLNSDVTAVRSLLRFLHLKGRIPDPMDGAVPWAAAWQRPPMTRKIRPDDVAMILASCDRDPHAGRRDAAGPARAPGGRGRRSPRRRHRLAGRDDPRPRQGRTRGADAAPGRCRGGDRGLLPECPAAGRG
jgi:hypothetical protein